MTLTLKAYMLYNKVNIENMESDSDRNGKEKPLKPLHNDWLTIPHKPEVINSVNIFFSVLSPEKGLLYCESNKRNMCYSIGNIVLKSINNIYKYRSQHFI